MKRKEKVRRGDEISIALKASRLLLVMSASSCTGFVYMMAEFDGGGCGSICYSLKEVSNRRKLRQASPIAGLFARASNLKAAVWYQKSLCVSFHINGCFSHSKNVSC